MSPAHVVSLHIYPLKGARGIAVPEARITERGIEGDRRYMVVDADGRFVSQREVSRLALVTAVPTLGGLRLEAPERPPLQVPLVEAESERRGVRLWTDDCEAIDQGDAAAVWLTAWLGRPSRLVRQPDGARRQVDPAYATGPDDVVSFADGYPLLVCSMESLADLNHHLETPLPMNRFRPNLVVRGWPGAWWEDRVRRLRAGAAELALVKNCARCVVTTVDQETARRGPEPLRTLARIRRRDRGVMFGENAIPVVLGRVRVGDLVETLRQGVPADEPAVGAAESG